MPTLLTLPLELRDQILEFVIFTPPDITSTLRRRKVSNDALDWSQLNRVHYISHSSAHQPTALSLLLVNHQLYTETAALLLRKKEGFQLDLAIVNETNLWPTWRHIPSRKLWKPGYPRVSETLGPILEHLDINIRLATEAENYNMPDCTRLGQRHPHVLSEELRGALSSFLERFFYLGAMGTPAPEGSKTANLCVNTLRFKVRTLAPNQRISQQSIPCRTIIGDVATHTTTSFTTLSSLYTVPNECVASFTTRLVQTIETVFLQVRNGTKASEMFLSRIGKLVVCVDGSEARLWDVSEMLREVKGDWSHDREAKTRLRRKRERLGLQQGDEEKWFRRAEEDVRQFMGWRNGHLDSHFQGVDTVSRSRARHLL